MSERLKEAVSSVISDAATAEKVRHAIEFDLPEIARDYGYTSTVDRMYRRVWPLPELLMIPWILQTALFDKNVLVYCDSMQEARGMLDAMISHSQKQYGQHIVRSVRRNHAGGEIEFINEFRIVFAVPSRSSDYGLDWLRVRAIR
ncbi:hypothetical protein SEA_SHAGRAT_93 [Rhodococcus phage Shagrat]|nr:hypothetical protein SEA_SHAGRAT_93 [Rhodococcus phage Shagrat]